MIQFKHSVICALAVSSMIFSSSCLADQREFAEDVAAALCGAVGAAEGGNSAAAAGTVICKYAVRVSDSAVSALIDKYFDGRDQKFADAACITIRYANGKVISPSSNAHCASRTDLK